MFPEYRDLIAKLRIEDSHFARLFEEHNKLDDKISGMTNNPVTGNLDDLDALKRDKLRLKDEMYTILREAAAREGK